MIGSALYLKNEDESHTITKKRHNIRLYARGYKMMYLTNKVDRRLHTGLIVKINDVI